MIIIPPGVWHTYANSLDVPAKYLLFISPGGFEKFLEGLSEMLRTKTQWTPEDNAKLQALAAQYDATV